MKTLVKGWLALAVAGAIAGNASATVIDFNDNAGGHYWLSSVTSNGYVATQVSLDYGSTPMGTNVSVDSSGAANNGTVHLDSWTNEASNSVWTLTKADGGAFNLLNFDFGSGYHSQQNGVQTLTVTGNYAAGGTVSQVFSDLTLEFQNLAVNNQFTSLSSVTFNAFGAANRSAYDNINVSEGGSVPEPATLALFSLGLAGLAVRRRKAA